jgi:hypothetical protein
MNIIYCDQPVEVINPWSHSIFLAGPTPRSSTVPSWRPAAIAILKEMGYDGQVIVPEREHDSWKINYDEQVEWEHYGLETCDVIAFWVPRQMATMPALTTNVEFGRYVASGRALYGRPENAEKCRYLDYIYKKYNRHPVYETLRELMYAATLAT